MTNPSEEAIRAACEEAGVDPDANVRSPIARQIIGKLVLALARRIDAEREAEPVAWAYVNSDGECEQIDWGSSDLAAMAGEPGITPLYTHPPKEPTT